MLVNTGKIYMDSLRAQQIFKFKVHKVKFSDAINSSGTIIKNMTRNQSVTLMPCNQSDFFMTNAKVVEFISPESLKLIRNFGLCLNTSEISVSGGLANEQKDQFTIQVNPCIYSSGNGCEPSDTVRLGLAN